MRVDDVLERVAPIDDRSHVPLLDQSLEPREVVRVRPRHLADHDSTPLRERRPPHRPRAHWLGDVEIDAVGRQHSHAIREGARVHRHEDDVVRRAAAGDILLRVIDRRVCPERQHERQMRAAAHSSDVRPEILRQLHRERPDAAGRTVHEDSLVA